MPDPLHRIALDRELLAGCNNGTSLNRSRAQNRSSELILRSNRQNGGAFLIVVLMPNQLDPVVTNPATSAQNAIYCFNENVQLFSNSQVEPEKYNLYRGLGELANAIKKLSNEIDAVKHAIDHIQSQVSKQ
jgi:hypothetical protein